MFYEEQEMNKLEMNWRVCFRWAMPQSDTGWSGQSQDQMYIPSSRGAFRVPSLQDGWGDFVLFGEKITPIYLFWITFML